MFHIFEAFFISQMPKTVVKRVIIIRVTNIQTQHYSSAIARLYNIYYKFKASDFIIL